MAKMDRHNGRKVFICMTKRKNKEAIIKLEYMTLKKPILSVRTPPVNDPTTEPNPKQAMIIAH